MKPLTRLENFLAKIAGDPDAKMDMKPKTRKEMYLDAITSGGGSGGGGSVEPLIVNVIPGEGKDPDILSATYKEIKDAMLSGKNVYLSSSIQLLPGQHIDSGVEDNVFEQILSVQYDGEYYVIETWRSKSFGSSSETGTLTQPYLPSGGDV